MAVIIYTDFYLYLSGCPIPVADDPDKIVIPKGRTLDTIVKNLTYVMEDEPVKNGSQSSPLFGGHQSWRQREKSFKLSSFMKVNLNPKNYSQFCARLKMLFLS